MSGHIRGKPRDDIDWVLLEGEYRAGLSNNYQLAARYSCSEGAIRLRAKRYGWTRDIKGALNDRVQVLTNLDSIEKAQQSVASHRDPDAVTVGKVGLRRDAERRAADQRGEDAIIEAIAQKQAGIIQKSKARIGRLQSIVEGMFEELVAQSMTPEQLARVADLVALVESQDQMAPDPSRMAKQVKAFKQLLALGSRADIVRKLAESLKTLTGLERQAHGINDNANGDGDQPTNPVESPSMNDAARRVAFLIANAARNKAKENQS